MTSVSVFFLVHEFIFLNILIYKIESSSSCYLRNSQIYHDSILYFIFISEKTQEFFSRKAVISTSQCPFLRKPHGNNCAFRKWKPTKILNLKKENTDTFETSRFLGRISALYLMETSELGRSHFHCTETWWKLHGCIRETTKKTCTCRKPKVSKLFPLGVHLVPKTNIRPNEIAKNCSAT